MSFNGVFHCENPDFTLRSTPDDVTFKVKRACLAKSQVFGELTVICSQSSEYIFIIEDMFACCDPQELPGTDDVIDIPETASILVLLLDVLHSPIEDLSKPTSGSESTPERNERRIIPLPLLEQIMSLADKYMVSSDIVDALHSHMLAQVSMNPLRIYGLAWVMQLPRIASTASMYLLQPLDTYSVKEIKDNIPDLEAYHQLVQLQALRSRRLKEVLAGEPLFPHGYGKCESHDQKAVLLWEQRKQKVAWRIHAGWVYSLFQQSEFYPCFLGTDVASDMAEVMQNFENCKTCSKAGDAALQMLAVS
jgi:hypothetical protein